MSELDALDPVDEPIILSDGTHVLIENLKSRQFFKLLRIITHGAMPVFRDLGLSSMSGLSRDEFVTRLLSMMLMSIPDAEDETIEFVRSMVKPAGLIERRQLNKQDTERNAALWAVVDENLYNPELDDLVTIIEAIIHREADDIQALGKRLQGMFNLAVKTGQVPGSPTSPTTTSSAASPASTISWPPNTDGMTSTSATSPSPDSANASPPSPNDASTGDEKTNNG